MDNISVELKEMLINEQRNEMLGHLLYTKIGDRKKDIENKKILQRIADDELKHYKQFQVITKQDVHINKVKLYFFYIISIVFGLTFGVKLLEKSEIKSQQVYSSFENELPMLKTVLEEEEAHELELINMLNEEKLNYMGSVVLGLNDALVELTGALAGYTFAFQNTKIIALTGLITGISAAFSMAASEYLATKQEEDTSKAAKSAIYTGIAYIFTVAMLILPFLILKNPFISILVTLLVAVIIIMVFNYYVAVAKDVSFKKRFLEMVVISLGVAAISFIVGVLVKQLFNIEV